VTGTDEQVEVRAVQGEQEEIAACALMIETFLPNADQSVAAGAWRRFVGSVPGQAPDRVRAAFLRGQLVGTYILEERQIWLSGAQVPVGVVGDVVVRKPFRSQGIGAAMMTDSFAYAGQRGVALLALYGAPKYYTPFGYVDIFDSSELRFRRMDVAPLGNPGLHVRAASQRDAASMSGLYQQSHSGYSGWAARSAAQEEHLLRFVEEWKTDRGDLLESLDPVVAVDSRGEIRGYLRQGWGLLRGFGIEVGASDSAATLSLAAYHASLRGPLQGKDDTIAWQLPADSPTAELLGDHIPVAFSFEHRPAEGWMACVIDLSALIEHLVGPWSGCSDFATDGFSLRVGHVRRCVGAPGLDRLEAALDETTLLQLLFGYRHLEWARLRPGCAVPKVASIEALFTNRPWIPPSNAF
jgi:GNAT superfamily N-acetyltransferase